METETTEVVAEVETTSQIMKDAAIKAAVGAVIYVVVSQVTTVVYKKIVGWKRFHKAEVTIETN